MRKQTEIDVLSLHNDHKVRKDFEIIGKFDAREPAEDIVFRFNVRKMNILEYEAFAREYNKVIDIKLDEVPKDEETLKTYLATKEISPEQDMALTAHVLSLTSEPRYTSDDWMTILLHCSDLYKFYLFKQELADFQFNMDTGDALKNS